LSDQESEVVYSEDLARSDTNNGDDASRTVENTEHDEETDALQKLQEPNSKLDKHHKAKHQDKDNLQGQFIIKKRKITSTKDYKPHDYKLIEE